MMQTVSIPLHHLLQRSTSLTHLLHHLTPRPFSHHRPLARAAHFHRLDPTNSLRRPSRMNTVVREIATCTLEMILRFWYALFPSGSVFATNLSFFDKSYFR